MSPGPLCMIYGSENLCVHNIIYMMSGINLSPLSLARIITHVKQSVVETEIHGHSSDAEGDGMSAERQKTEIWLEIDIPATWKALERRQNVRYSDPTKKLPQWRSSS